MKTISALGAIILLLGMFFGVYRYIDTRYAIALENQNEHQSLIKSLAITNQRLEQKILQDRRDTKQNQIWALEEKNINKKSINDWSPDDRAKYKQLQKEMADLDKQLATLPPARPAE